MPSAAIYDCEGALPTDEERAFFRDVDPAGFILFARHCETSEQIVRHTDALKEAVGREDVLILVDQEGGRVARLQPPAFPAHQPMAVFGKMWRLDPARARKAARLNAYLLGRMTASLGINVNCVPMLDVPQIDSDPVVIGDRVIASHPEQIAALGAEVIAGLMEGGALPVIKHLPGHGRSLVDSHHDLPEVTASQRDLQATDFPPFKANADALIGMTAHIVYTAYDKTRCATMSPTVIKDVIRGKIGFDGLLLSDDVKMKALQGPLELRAKESLEAGCDAALLCNFTMAEKRDAAPHVPALEGAALARYKMALAALPARPEADDLSDEYAQLADLMKPGLVA
ncbi:MAG: beta-N-acetylhexosaminidase [Pseudomonadota bacterium]